VIDASFFSRDTSRTTSKFLKMHTVAAPCGAFPQFEKPVDSAFEA
jgi:hypothetical protein